MKQNNILIIIVVAILVGAGGFFAGIQYQKSQRTALVGQFGNAGFGANRTDQFQGRNGGQVNRPVIGEILSQDDTSITVKMQDGSSKIVLVSKNTSINKAATATTSDLKAGEKVAAFGTANADGSITAQSIQLNPVFRANAGGGQQNPSPTQ